MVVFITEIVALISAIVPVIVMITKITNGQKCQLRSDMLQIYYRNKDAKRIHQYEFENFVMLYDAYKALKGNSFIDTIYGEVKKWEIVM
jgi:hypothetical protein